MRGVYTHSAGTCDASVSRFDKMFEDGRVQCALTEGSAYYPDGTSACDNSDRPSYNNDGGGGGGSNDGGGGGGSTGVWFIIFLALSLLSLPNVWKRFISITRGATVSCYVIAISLVLLISGCSSSSQNNPVIDIKINPANSTYAGVAIQVDRRLVLAAKKRGVLGKDGKVKEKAVPIICAEPFPDGAALLDKLKTLNFTVDGKFLETTDSYKFNVTIPFALHPAVKFYRDGVFALCQAAMNGLISMERDRLIKIEPNNAGTTGTIFGSMIGITSTKSAAEGIKVSAFELQLYLLSQYVRDIFIAEAQREKAEADKKKAEVEALRLKIK